MWLIIAIIVIALPIILIALNGIILWRVVDPEYRAGVAKFMDKGLRRGLSKFAVCCLVYGVIVMDIFEELRDRHMSSLNHRS